MERPADSSDSLVSWQTIFWPLLGAVFNVALQNAGNIPGVDGQSTTLKIALRSSPIVCLVDTINCLGAIIWLIIRGISPVDAARHVWLGRFQTPRSNTITTTVPTIDAQAFARDKLWGFGIVAFLLATFPQIVKLFGCQNIPAGQSLAAVFAAAFVVPEILRFIATFKKRSPLPLLSVRLRRSGNDGGARRFWEAISLHIAILIQVFLWMWIISQSWLHGLFVDRIGNGRENAGQFEGHDKIWIAAAIPLLSIVLFVSVLAVVMVVSTQNDTGRAEWNIDGGVVTSFATAVKISLSHSVIIGFCFWATCFVVIGGMFSVGFRSAPFFANYLSLIAVCCMALPSLLIGLALYSFLVLWRASGPNGSSNVDPLRLLMGSGREFCTALFLVLNMGTFFLYYRFMYTSDGTVKPEWAEELG